MGRTINTIGVIGAGQMGSGIAQVFAVAGYKIILQDIKNEFCERGMNIIKASLSKIVEKQKITDKIKDAALANIRSTTNMNDIALCDLVVEAIPEDISLKSEVFKKLDSITKKDAILATNTSSISITRIANMTKRPDKVIGMHFMNPVPVMQCVEIINGKSTGEDVYNTVLELVSKLGKTAVTSKDSPGFIMNRILMPMINEAVFAFHDGVAAAADIDTGTKLSFNWPIGPLALADLIGLDTVLSILGVLHAEFKDEKYRPCPLLQEYVKKGWLGRKTKRGFYVY